MNTDDVDSNYFIHPNHADHERNCPDVLYHYTSVAPIILKDKTVKSSPPNEFNDPFEFSFRVSDQDISKNSVRKFIPDLVRQEYEDLRKIVSDPPTFREYRKNRMKDKHELIRKLTNSYPQIKEIHRDRHQDNISSVVGVTCFCESADNLLLWSHYANLHHGIAIGFSTRHGLLGGLGLYDVKYRQQRPLVEPILRDNRAKEVATTKSLEWKYEQEWRLLISAAVCKKETKGGKEVRLYSFEAASVVEVFFGCRCTDAVRNETLSILSNNEYSHVEKYQMEMHKTEYKLAPRQLE